MYEFPVYLKPEFPISQLGEADGEDYYSYTLL